MAAIMTPVPRQLSPAFRLILGGIIFAGAAVFFLSMHHGQSGPRLMSFRESGDKWWTRTERPTPVLTPRPQPTAMVRPIVVQAPAVRPTPKAQPTPCQVCQERAMRYQRAIETGMGAGNGNPVRPAATINARELPQVVNPWGALAYQAP